MGTARALKTDPPKTATSYGWATAGDKIEIIAADLFGPAGRRDSSPAAIFLPQGCKGQRRHGQ